MGVAEDSTLVSFDADDALGAARETSGDGIRLCVEYTTDGFRVLYADETTVALYGDREAMVEHFEEVHSYVHIDFTEKDLFEELFVGAGGVQSFVTYMDHVTVIRFLVGHEGLFLGVTPGVEVTRVVNAVEQVVQAAESDDGQ